MISSSDIANELINQKVPTQDRIRDVIAGLKARNAGMITYIKNMTVVGPRYIRSIIKSLEKMLDKIQKKNGL